MNLRKLNKPLLIVLTALLLITCAIGGVFAKYLAEFGKDGEVGSAEFYFESNVLTEEGAEYTLNANTNEITFTLKNFADSLRISEVDISCTVSVSGNATATLSEATLTKNQNSTTTVTLSGMQNGETYVVTATGTGGYQKTLKATFTVRTVNQGFYQFVDDSNEHYVVLTVWTINKTGTATITIPTGLIPDRTDPTLENVGTSFNLDFAANQSYVLKFLKTAEYSESSTLTVKMGDVEATPSVPS